MAKAKQAKANLIELSADLQVGKRYNVTYEITDDINGEVYTFDIRNAAYLGQEWEGCGSSYWNTHNIVFSTPHDKGRGVEIHTILPYPDCRITLLEASYDAKSEEECKVAAHIQDYVQMALDTLGDIDCDYDSDNLRITLEFKED